MDPVSRVSPPNVRFEETRSACWMAAQGRYAKLSIEQRSLLPGGRGAQLLGQRSGIAPRPVGKRSRWTKPPGQAVALWGLNRRCACPRGSRPGTRLAVTSALRCRSAVG